MNSVFYKLTLKNDTTFLYELPYKSNFTGLWEKHYTLDISHCKVVLDLLNEEIVEKLYFMFYDNPPYQDTKEEEEEYNNILSTVKLLYNKELTEFEDTIYDKTLLENVVDDIPDNSLVISVILI